MHNSDNPSRKKETDTTNVEIQQKETNEYIISIAKNEIRDKKPTNSINFKLFDWCVA